MLIILNNQTQWLYLTPKENDFKDSVTSDYCKEIENKNIKSVAGVEKIVPSLSNKEKYVHHYRNLQLHIQLGINSIISMVKNTYQL